MPHDPARVEDTLAWVTRALSDLRAGTHQLTATPPFTCDAVFHAQQAAEKAFKAFLAWHDDPFPKTRWHASGVNVARSIPRLLRWPWRLRR
jgi:hypothetical protein